MGINLIQANNKRITDLNFSIPSTQEISFTNFTFEKKVVKIIFFVSPHCRFSVKYMKFISTLQLENGLKKYQIILVSPNYPQSLIPDDLSYSDIGADVSDMKIIKDRFNIDFPFIYDGENQILTNFFGIKTTPTVVVLGLENQILYKGKIGDIKKSGEIDTSFFKEFVYNKEKQEEFTITKVTGTEIKTKKDLNTTAKILRRYSNETVRISEGDKEKISFFMKFNNKVITLFFIWEYDNINSRDNLLKVTDIYKRYRKRGLSLITICVSDKTHKDLILQSLQRSQTSTHNFVSNFYETQPIYKLIGYSNKTIAPILVSLGKNGELQFIMHGNIMENQLRSKILHLLDK